MRLEHITSIQAEGDIMPAANRLCQLCFTNMHVQSPAGEDVRPDWAALFPIPASQQVDQAATAVQVSQQPELASVPAAANKFLGH
jgi:hypothetical protein